jgi:cytochrome c oxidase subunit 2
MVSDAAETTGFCLASGMSEKAAGQPRMERELNMALTTPLRGLSSLALGFVTTLTLAGSVAAEALQKIGEPVPNGMGFQPPSTPVAVEAQGLENMVLWIVGLITLFVCVLLVYVIVRFNAKANPIPAKFTHNTPIEVIWTLVPILVLVFIGSFSLPALFDQMEIPAADLTVKVTGNQWYWSYAYPDAEVSFDSVLLEKKDLAANGYKDSDYLLAVDNALVVPVNKVVKVEMTGADVIHAWAVPAFGVMHSAVPGRLGETWFKATQEGIYFGQCTTLCGSNHAYMPIEVKVVSQEAYDKWLEQAKGGNYQLASN